MANEQNLTMMGKNRGLTREEAQRIGSIGGKNSAKKKAERKTLREELLLLLSENNTQNKISVAILKQAEKGNTKAYEVIRDTIGEKPKESINVSGELNNPFAGMSTDELRKIINAK
jgi:hypothetical protein